MQYLSMWKGVAAVPAYLCIFWFAGAALPDRVHGRFLSRMLILGFLLYFSVFQVIALPMKLLKQPLHYLTILWIVVLLFLIKHVVSDRRDVLADSIRNLFNSREKLLFGACFLGFCGILCLALGMNINHISDFDAMYYIGLPVSSAYTDTIELTNVYNGVPLKAVYDFYKMNTSTIHSAVMFQTFGLHPLVENKFTFTIICGFLFELILFLTGYRLFERSEKKAFVFSVISTAALLGSYSIAGVSHYFAYRTYEGKAIVSYLYMAMIFLFFVCIYCERHLAWAWCGLFFCSISSISFSNTALFVTPLLSGIMLLPYLVRKRSVMAIQQAILVLFPCVIWLLLYKIL